MEQDAGRGEISHRALAATKLLPPLPPDGVQDRPALLRRVAPARKALTVLIAPAGWGKSTLLAQWSLAARDRKVAWVRLDVLDDEPVRFWSALTVSLRAAGLVVSSDVPVTPRAAGPELWHVVVPSLVDDLAAAQEPLTIAIDDYHHVTSAHVHDGLRYLVEHMPRESQVILASRQEPPLGLAAMRARGLLEEIRLDDLALTPAESAAHVRRFGGVELASEDAASLQRRTEGWPAGVHLAALSLRDRDDPASFIARFAGDHRHIADYLTTEVLERVPEAMSRFLRRCSVLDELPVDLCTAITQQDDAGERLAQAERLGLFVSAVDDARTRYRMHALVSSWLRHRLAVEAPEESSELHRRAAAWYLEAGAVDRAGDHAMAAGDLDLVRAIVAGHAAQLMAEGHVRTLERWLGQLPEELVLQDPLVALAAANAAALAVDLGRADRLAEAAATALADASAIGVGVDPNVELAASRATISLLRRDLVSAERHGRVAASFESHPGPERYGIGHVTWATALFWLGRCGEARDAIDVIWPRIEDLFVRGIGAGVLASALIETGDGPRAERVARSALVETGRRSSDQAPELVLAHLALGAALCERAELGDGERHLLAGIELSRVWRAPAQSAYGQLRLARLRMSQGRPDDAAELIRAAAPVIETARTSGLLASVLARTQRSWRSGRARGLHGPGEPLTPREIDILRLLPSSLSQREIGARLEVSLDTVKTHTRHVYDKLGVSSRAEAVERAREIGLL